MYAPKHFEENSIDVIHDLIEAHPLSTLITLKENFPEVNHIPMLLLRESKLGLLQGHVARANSLWQTHDVNTDVLAIFQGPEAYITPSWYASKAETSKVVPTWNYIAVHVRGKIRFIQDKNWLLAHVSALTERNEKTVGASWQVSDAPQDFIEKLVTGIIGFEIAIEHIVGKWKIGQNRSSADQASMIKGLESGGHIALVNELRSRIDIAE